MEELAVALEKGRTDVRVGNLFTFVTYIDGKPTRLTGAVEIMMPSSKARKLGLTKSKRRRLFLGLRVKGYPDLIWKDKGQVKPLSAGANERQLLKKSVEETREESIALRAEQQQARRKLQLTKSALRETIDNGLHHRHKEHD